MDHNVNIFDRLHADKELPEKTKKELMGKLDAFRLFLDIADLFTVKNAKVGGEMLGTVSGTIKNAKKS